MTKDQPPSPAQWMHRLTGEHYFRGAGIAWLASGLALVFLVPLLDDPRITGAIWAAFGCFFLAVSAHHKRKNEEVQITFNEPNAQDDPPE